MLRDKLSSEQGEFDFNESQPDHHVPGNWDDDDDRFWQSSEPGIEDSQKVVNGQEGRGQLLTPGETAIPEDLEAEIEDNAKYQKLVETAQSSISKKYPKIFASKAAFNAQKEQL